MTQIASLESLQDWAQLILKEARTQGADQAQVIITSQENIGTRFGEKHITQNTQRNQINFLLRTQIGQKIGIYQGSKPNQKNLSTLVKDAISLTKFSVPDPEFPGFLEEQPNYPKSSKKIIEMTPQDISDAIKQTISAASSVDAKKISAVAGNLNYIASRSFLMNSYDVAASNEGSVISSVVNVAATNGSGESRSSSFNAAVTFENLKVENRALELIALNSGGSFRDAEGLLDQAITFSGKEKEIKAEDIKDFLGIVDTALIGQSECRFRDNVFRACAFYSSPTVMPMLRAVPSMVRMAPSTLSALRSGRLRLAISSICLRVTCPTLVRLGSPEPFAIWAAFLRSTAAGGVLVMKVNERSE